MSAKIATALHSVMEACGYVQKTGKNSFHGYKYAGEADLLDKLRPAMVQHGLLLLPSGKSVTGPDEHGNVTVAIEYTLAHKDGDIWPEKLVAFGCGNDRAKNGSVGDKGVYKALTGANKYLLFKLFQIETGDDPEQDDGAHDSSSAPATGRNAAGANPPARTSHGSGGALSKDDLIAKIRTFDLVSDLVRWANSDAVDGAYRKLSANDKAGVDAAYRAQEAKIEADDPPFKEAAE